MKFIRLILFIGAVGFSCGVSAVAPHGAVTKLVAAKLPALGHRNWIIVADSAYPLQIAPGIETVTVTESQLSAVKQVLAELGRAKHVRPVIYIDSELKFVSESTVPGISKYRRELNGLLAGKATQRMLHENIIKKLDEAGKTFKVLLIKTPLTMPYTSVFFQLECGYWSAASEQKLRDAMKLGSK